MNENQQTGYAQLTEDMHTSYAAMMEITTRACEQMEAVIGRRRELIEARDAVLLTYQNDQKSMGANEATRDAFLRRETATERERLEAEEAILRQSENTLKLASLTVERLRVGLRILEASTSKGHLDFAVASAGRRGGNE